MDSILVKNVKNWYILPQNQTPQASFPDIFHITSSQEGVLKYFHIPSIREKYMRFRRCHNPPISEAYMRYRKCKNSYVISFTGLRVSLVKVYII